MEIESEENIPDVEVCAQMSEVELDMLSFDELKETVRVLQQGYKQQVEATGEISFLIQPPKAHKPASTQRRKERLDGSCRSMEYVVELLQQRKDAQDAELAAKAVALALRESRSKELAEEKVKKEAELALWVPIRTLLQSYNYMLASDTKVTLEPMKSFAKANKIVTISKKMTKQDLFDAITLAMSLDGLRVYLFAPAAPPSAAVAPSTVAS